MTNRPSQTIESLCHATAAAAAAATAADNLASDSQWGKVAAALHMGRYFSGISPFRE